MYMRRNYMSSFDSFGIAEKIMEALEKEWKEMKIMNVMLLGKTGVGKSTLINNLFNERIAETGIGRPVTQEIRQYSKEKYPLTIFPSIARLLPEWRITYSGLTKLPWFADRFKSFNIIKRPAAIA